MPTRVTTLDETRALPELIAAEAKLRALATKEGIRYDFGLPQDTGTLRTEADTTQILKWRDADYKVYVAALKKNPSATPVPIETWRPIASFGKSYHNWGAAFDAHIIGQPAGMSADQALGHLGALAPQCGLRWGGTFTPARRDRPHFELPITLAEAERRWKARGGSAGIAPKIVAGGAAAAALLFGLLLTLARGRGL